MGRVTSPPLLEQSCPRSGGLVGAKCGAREVQPSCDRRRTAGGGGEVCAPFRRAAQLRPESFVNCAAFAGAWLWNRVRDELHPEYRLASGEGDAGTCPAQRGGGAAGWEPVERLRRTQRLPLGERYLCRQQRALLAGGLGGGQLGESSRRSATIPCHDPSSGGLFQRCSPSFA